MLTLFTGFEVRRHWDDSLVQELARNVARDTLPLIAPVAIDMNAAELRGYVRSLAAASARLHVHQCVDELRMRHRCKDDLTAAVLERAVHLIVRERCAAPVFAIPQPHVQRRNAA